jgi:hypothetical protein
MWYMLRYMSSLSSFNFSSLNKSAQVLHREQREENIIKQLQFTRDVVRTSLVAVL